MEGIWEINGPVLFVIFCVLGVAALGLVVLLIIDACKKKPAAKEVKPVVKAKALTYREEFEKLPKEEQTRVNDLVNYGVCKDEGIVAKEKASCLQVTFKKYNVAKVTIKEGVTKIAISVQNPELYKESIKLKPVVLVVNEENENSIKSAIDVSYNIYKKLK